MAASCRRRASGTEGGHPRHGGPTAALRAHIFDKSMGPACAGSRRDCCCGAACKYGDVIPRRRGPMQVSMLHPQRHKSRGVGARLRAGGASSTRRGHDAGGDQMAVYRTFLFAPGNHPRRVEKALSLDADAVILDLEDACPIAEKKATRAVVVAACQRPRAGPGLCAGERHQPPSSATATSSRWCRKASMASSCRKSRRPTRSGPSTG